jgi:Mg2+ and Co2+ transporter CorA
MVEEIIRGIKEERFEVSRLIDFEAMKMSQLFFSEDLKSAFLKSRKVPLEYKDENALTVNEVGFVDYKGKWITRINPLSPISSSIILVKAGFTVLFKDYREGYAVLVTKQEMINNLLKEIEKEKKELEEFEKRLKKNPKSKLYAEMVRRIGDRILRLNQAIEWLKEWG